MTNPQILDNDDKVLIRAYELEFEVYKGCGRRLKPYL